MNSISFLLSTNTSSFDPSMPEFSASSADGNVRAPKAGKAQKSKVVVVANDKVESAVYAYIQAIRALGRTSVGTHEIAKALGITTSDVLSTMASLAKKGVKLG